MTDGTTRFAPPGVAVAAVTFLLLAGCGGGDESDTKPVTPTAVQQTVSGLLSACADMELDTPQVHDASPRVTGHVNRLIRQFSEEPDLDLRGTELKADTLRDQMVQSYQLLQDCKPQDAKRVRDAAEDR